MRNALRPGNNEMDVPWTYDGIKHWLDDKGIEGLFFTIPIRRDFALERL